MRLRAKLDLRKEITRDYKDKYQKVADELILLKKDVNVGYYIFNTNIDSTR